MSKEKFLTFVFPNYPSEYFSLVPASGWVGLCRCLRPVKQVFDNFLLSEGQNVKFNIGAVLRAPHPGVTLLQYLLRADDTLSLIIIIVKTNSRVRKLFWYIPSIAGE